MRMEGFSSRAVCLSTHILELQATRRPISDTNGCRSTRARNVKERLCWNDCVRERETGTVAERVAWPNPSINCAHAYIIIRVRIARRAADFDTGSARSVYVEGTRNHNEGHVSTPAGYLLLQLARARLSASYILAGKTHTDSACAVRWWFAR